MLNTEDADTPLEELVYNLELLTSGRVAFKEAPEEGVLNFTQSHINKGEVVFVHQGEALRWLPVELKEIIMAPFVHHWYTFLSRKKI